MSVFFLDSNCELWYDKVEKLGIEYISMPYSIEGQQYDYDLGKNTNFKEFYAKIRQGIVPITSGLNSQNYIDTFTPFLEQGNDIIYVTFSNAMSGTFEQLKIAIATLKETFPDRKITYVDTKNISIGAELVVYEAALKYKEGASVDEIVDFVNSFRNESCVYFIVDDLMYLKAGGRLSLMSATFGTILGIKPIIGVNEDGVLTTVQKVNGRKKSILTLLDLLKQNGQNLADYPLIIAHADCLDDAEFLKNKIIDTFGEDLDLWIQDIGPTVGTHCGPGTIGIAFHSKNKI